MRISEKLVRATNRPSVDSIEWKDRKPNDGDYNRAITWLNRQRLHTENVLGYENDTELQLKIHNVAYWMSQRKRMTQWGINDKPLIVTGSSLFVRSSLVRGTYRWPDNFEFFGSSDSQDIANQLTETTEGSSVFTRFNGYTTLGNDGFDTPCFIARSIGTIEQVEDELLRIKEIYLIPEQEILFETQDIIMSPLSQIAKLGKEAVRIG